MLNPDQINGTFEALGALFILRHCKAVWGAKEVKGVDTLATVFFTAWGAWNLYFYPHLNQPYSFYGGIALVLANLFWVGLLLKYRKTGIKPPINPRTGKPYYYVVGNSGWGSGWKTGPIAEIEIEDEPVNPPKT